MDTTLLHLSSQYLRTGENGGNSKVVLLAEAAMIFISCYHPICIVKVILMMVSKSIII